MNLFGLITIALGLILLGRWAWRKFSGPSDIGKLRRGTRIISMTGVDPKAADLFKPVGKMREGAQLIHIQWPQQDYLAVVEMVAEALYLKAAYTTSPDKLAHDIAALIEA